MYVNQYIFCLFTAVILIENILVFINLWIAIKASLLIDVFERLFIWHMKCHFEICVNTRVFKEMSINQVGKKKRSNTNTEQKVNICHNQKNADLTQSHNVDFA